MKAPATLLAAMCLLLGTPGAEAKAPPFPQPDLGRGALAISVRVKYGTSTPLPLVFFAKLEPGTDSYLVAEIIPANFATDKQTYLLNAEPGRYVAVVASFRAESWISIEQNYFLPTEVIRMTEVELAPGRIVFMGDFTLRYKSVELSQLDPVQAHYCRLLKRESAKQGVGFHKGELSGELRAAEQTTAAGRKFWTLAVDRTFRRQPAWQDGAKRELERLDHQAP